MFSFFRNRRRQKLLADPFPPAWEAILRRNVGHYSRLSDAERARLRDHTRVLVAEKEWEGANGLVVTEEMKVTIAAQAGLLLLGLPEHDYFARVASVVVYPAGFEIPDRDEFGEIDDTFPAMAADGQSVYRGPVLVSWGHALAEGRDPACGQNIVLHEFAHQLDDLDGVANGTPPLEDPAAAARWRAVMQAALDDHRASLDRGEETFFTEHAGENETEFFADATETFYCCPADLREQYPDVYALLAAYYRVDPVTWFPGGGED
jgi:Mlc titration factor MtfA (ptsG expression regulator)